MVYLAAGLILTVLVSGFIWLLILADNADRADMRADRYKEMYHNTRRANDRLLAQNHRLKNGYPRRGLK